MTGDEAFVQAVAVVYRELDQWARGGHSVPIHYVRKMIATLDAARTERDRLSIASPDADPEKAALAAEIKLGIRRANYETASAYDATGRGRTEGASE